MHRASLFLVFFVILPGIFLTSCGEETISPRDKLSEIMLRHHVKKMTEFVTFYRSGIPGKEIKHVVDFYSYEGLKTQTDLYDAEGKLEQVSIREYNGNRKLISTKGYNPDKILLFNEIVNYVEDSGYYELYHYLPDGSYKYRNKSIQDKEGRVLTLEWYWPSGLQAVNKFEYDGWKKMKDTEYGADDSVRYQWNFIYDENNNLAEKIQTLGDGTLNYKITFRHSPEGLLLNQEEGRDGFSKKITALEYDKYSLRSIKTEYSANMQIKTVFRYAYEFY